MTYLLSLNKIVKNFGAVQALKGVSLDLNAGEILGLVGDNGAGKSTLIKTLSGVIIPDSGVITLGGEPVVFNNPRAATDQGIATVYQDLALCENLDVVANLFLGHEELFKNIKFPRILAGFRMQRAAIDLLHSLSINLPSVRRRVEQLSGGQRQAVAIARSLARDPKIILLDEPTAALGAAQRRDLIHLMRKLRERGLGVICITHNLNEVMEVADRVVVLRQGLAISSAPIQEITESSLIAVITGISDELSIKKAGSKK
jgi:D-xylose transport system ATP-binding protein